MPQTQTFLFEIIKVLGCKDIGTRKSKFVMKTHFLYLGGWFNFGLRGSQISLKSGNKFKNEEEKTESFRHLYQYFFQVVSARPVKQFKRPVWSLIK